MCDEDRHTSLTDLLREWAGGNEAALERLVPLVYADLRKTARLCIRRERPGFTLEPTELVHESFLRLQKSNLVDVENRASFYAFTATLMRRFLVDYARARMAKKRGDTLTQAQSELTDMPISLTEDPIALIQVNEALNHLAAVDPDLVKLVEMKYFAGYTEDEIAILSGTTRSSVQRAWKFARQVLASHLEESRSRCE